ncbi:MAG: amino acid permease, partial [Myxococcota bacterium]|nr:amino acid permease [Myxococcota bacterium]
GSAFVSDGASFGALAVRGDLAIALVWVSFSYSGWNAAAYVAGEVRDPGRALPRALLGGTAIVTLLYLALNVAFLASAPPEVLAGQVDVAHVAARHLLGPEVGVLVGAVVAVGLATTVGALAMTGPRVYERMGLDHPRLAVLTTSRRGRGPLRAIVLQTLVAIALAATATFEALLTYIGFTLAISAALTLAGVFVLRAREPDLERPYRAWGLDDRARDRAERVDGGAHAVAAADRGARRPRHDRRRLRALRAGVATAREPRLPAHLLERVRAARRIGSMRSGIARLLVLALAVLGGGCQVRSHLDPEGPRYAGIALTTAPDAEPDLLRVVSFNIEYAVHVERATELLRTHPELRAADVVLLQEMDARGTASIADALRLHHVYYPATERHDRGFGNAILSRWPIVDDHKILLPHPSPLHGGRRIAVAATIAAPSGPIAVYAVHAETAILALEGRLDQLERVLDDVAARYPSEVPVIIGGDFNTAERWVMPRLREGFFLRRFEHASRSADATADYFFGSLELDHVFVRALEVVGAGTVRTAASDHRALYVVLEMPS